MPLKNFNNLKDKKKKNILLAISSCLKKKSYDDLSVNDIVLEADISRGSFYNYFVDKNDAVTTLVESKVKKHFEQFIVAIKDSNNSLFDGTKKIYNEIKDILKDEINLTIMRNMKFFIELSIGLLYSEEHESYLKELVNWLTDNTIEGKTILNTKEKMANVIDMIFILIMDSVFAYTFAHKHKNLDIDNFEYKLDIIKNGTKCI